MAKRKKNFYDEDINKIPSQITEDDPFFGWHLDEYQLNFVNAMLNPNNIAVFCNAKAGSGKTSLAVATAKILVKGGRYDNAIYCVSPTQEERLGYLPGDITEKTEVYFQPLAQALELIGENPLLMSDPKQAFWIQPTTHLYMRGMNIEKSILILDECQNFFLDDCKKVFTRVHDNCLVVVIGHTGQNDLYKNKSHSGFAPYIEHFRNEPYVQICELKNNYRGKFSQKADELELS